jgi:4-amino-4-deoxy-L-arabinose transferase-like glycosyltransferase
LWTESHKKKQAGILLTMLVIGLCLRIAFIFTLEHRVYWEDETDYLALAENMKAGKGYVDAQGHPTAFRAVGYPLMLTGLFYLNINSLTEIRCFQALLSVFTILFVFGLARRVFGAGSAMMAALICVLYPYFVFMPATVLGTTWFGFLLLAATYTLYIAQEKNGQLLYVLSGLLFGVLVLTRPTGAVLLLAAALWLFYKKGRPLSRTLKPLSLLVGTAFLVVTPWMARNQQAVGSFTLSTNGGRNLWLGNNPQATATSGSVIPLPERLADKMAGAASEKEQDSLYKMEALRFIKNHFVGFITLSLKKAIAFWRLDPSPTTDGYIENSPLIRLTSVLSFSPLLILGIYALFGKWSGKHRDQCLWLFYFVAFTAVHAVVITKVRYRLPLDYFLIISASYGLVHISRYFSFLRIPLKKLEEDMLYH